MFAWGTLIPAAKVVLQEFDAWTLSTLRVVVAAGILLAISTGRRSAGMQMMRQHVIRWLIYILVWGLLFPGIDNYAHIGGFAAGFLLGKVMADRQPADVVERRRAYALGWTTGFAVLTSFALMLVNYFSSSIGLG